MLAYVEVLHGQVGQPPGKGGVDVEFVARRVRQEAQQRLGQHEGRAGGPGLRHVCADVLHRKGRLVAFERGVQLRQLVEQEVTCCSADVVRDTRRFRTEAVKFEAERDDRVVVRPD